MGNHLSRDISPLFTSFLSVEPATAFDLAHSLPAFSAMVFLRILLPPPIRFDPHCLFFFQKKETRKMGMLLEILISGEDHHRSKKLIVLRLPCSLRHDKLAAEVDTVDLNKQSRIIPCGVSNFPCSETAMFSSIISQYYTLPAVVDDLHLNLDLRLLFSFSFFFFLALFTSLSFPASYPYAGKKQKRKKPKTEDSSPAPPRRSGRKRAAPDSAQTIVKPRNPKRQKRKHEVATVDGDNVTPDEQKLFHGFNIDQLTQPCGPIQTEARG
jgi:hypothetical protein